MDIGISQIGGQSTDSGAGAGPGMDVSQTGAVVSPEAAAPFLGWNDTTITLLRLYWAEGLSASEIGRRLGCKKNAVIGKAHRVHLPARPSPIGTPFLRGNAKLSEADVMWIRAHYCAHSQEFGSKGLARKFGVSRDTIQSVMCGKTWRM